MLRGNQRSPAHCIRKLEAFWQRQKFRVAPHVETASCQFIFCDNGLQRRVIVGNFKRRKAFFAKRTGRIAPEFPTFTTTQLVDLRHQVSNRSLNSSSTCKTDRATAKWSLRGDESCSQLGLARREE